MLTEANIKWLLEGRKLTIAGWWDFEGLKHFESNGSTPIIPANKRGHEVFKIQGKELILIGGSPFLNSDITVQLYLAYLDDLQWKKIARDVERWGYARECE